MAIRGVIIFVALLSSFVVACYGEGLFSELENTLSVSASPTGNNVKLEADKDDITVSWNLNNTSTNTTNYKNVEVKLCYLEESQKDRPWRKTADNLKRDKTCQFMMAKKEFSTKDSTTYTIKKDVSTAHYFIRVYVRDAPKGKLIAYGQTNGLDLEIKGISGRSASIDVAASVFSAFSVLSLVFFYFMEKRKAKRAS